MALTFHLVETDDDIARTARVAHDIWFEYWPALIGQAQTEYMVKNMQSLAAITRDIRTVGYRYWLLFDEEGTCVGYTSSLAEDFSACPDSAEAAKHGEEISKRSVKRLFISKIYLYAQERGKHYASRVIEFYEQLCREEGLTAMYLTVNRDNELGIRAYLGRGFQTIQELAADIGEGFVMDDYIMCKML
ncbi:MAG: GNAT family N-acetyltransferase [Coriobacteriia bacterium]|nr:GNAT family N-acetyltransferase [Coriobacteriia bacterium]